MLVFLKLFDEMYTKYKPLITVLFFAMAFTSLFMVYRGIDSYGSLLKETKEYLIKNEIRLENLEQDVDENRQIIRHIVTRADFNAYAERKDNETIKQMEFNAKISEQLGYISGQMFVLEKKYQAISG